MGTIQRLHLIQQSMQAYIKAKNCVDKRMSHNAIILRQRALMARNPARRQENIVGERMSKLSGNVSTAFDLSIATTHNYFTSGFD